MTNYKPVDTESDLEKLLPGDQVKVNLGSGARWMTYKGMDHQGKDQINQESTCTFVEGSGPKLNLWTSAVRYLQFNDDGSVHFNHLFIQHKQLSPESLGYEETRSLLGL